MTRWTGRLLATLRRRRAKPAADVPPSPAAREQRTARPAAKPPPSAADVTAVIGSQHERVKALLEAVRQQTGHRRAAAFHTLRLTLALHETAEEQAIHPQALRQLGPYDRAASDRIAEEQTAGQTIAALELVDVDSDQFNFTFGHFAASVTEHAAAEEADEWPALRQITDPPVLRAMVKQMQAVTELAADRAAPGRQASFAEMQEWAKARLPAPPAS
jgi:hemerythrin superfamily protein